MAFGPESTTHDVLEGIDLRGRTALVTGASSGLGAETARALASVGAEVVLAARQRPKLEGVAASIRDSLPDAALSVLELDLTRPDSIRAAAKQFLGEHSALHLLVNNAGVMACPLMRTEQGYEMQLATNHLGHFLFTCLLADALLAGAPSRVVNLSSGGHRFGGIDFDDPNYEHREYDKFGAYGQSKTANVLFSVELTRRLADRGVTSNAVHPGVIMTELARHMTEQDIQDLMANASAESGGGSGGGMTFKTVEAGAATSVWAATTPELEGRGGLYCEDCHVARNDGDGLGYEEYAVDPEAAKRLWALSEELVGERFDP